MAPDNSLEAYRLAAQHGADGIECDVRFTSDDVVVMLHDPVVAGLGALNGINFATLRQVHPEIPTLDETLRALPDPAFLLNIEIKNDPDEPGFDPTHRMGRVIASWIATHELYGRVLVSSFNRATVDEVRANDPTIPTGLLLDHNGRFPSLLPGIASDGHEWVLPHHSRLAFRPSRAIEAAHGHGLSIGTWTLDQTWRIVQLSKARIDAIVTNDPGRTRDALKE